MNTVKCTISPVLLTKCLIGDGDVVMNCMVKVPTMINQIQQTMKSRIPTKITMENFQKRDGKIFTSETTVIELDDTVSN